ncbi:hypothetical protein BDW75DRAFT_250229 [Aspergillus navahoensis]
MDYHRPLDLLHAAEESVWVEKINAARVDRSICSWASGFHPEKLPYRLHGGFISSYNLGQQIVFDDGTTWFLRLPRASSISPEHADEKVAMEVEALLFIQEKTSIPVPKFYAWEEISDADIEYVYRQMAHVMLQLFKLDFNHIGNLPTPKTTFPAPSRPLMWKGHEILRSLIPELTNTTYDRGPFKLICDDFSLANVILKSKNDLTITGVVDIEWVYAGPAQMFGSAPWWLLLDRPVNDEWDFEDDQAPKATDCYFKCLEIFIQLTNLVKWSRDTGAMWLHMLLSSGFFDNLTFPCMQLRKHKGEQWWDEYMKGQENTEEIEKFVADKQKDLAVNDEVKNKVDHYKFLMDNEKMTTEDFIPLYPLFSDLMRHGHDEGES